MCAFLFLYINCMCMCICVCGSVCLCPFDVLVRVCCVYICMSQQFLHLDINECATNVHNCKSNERCVNKPGRFICKCANGYKSVNGTCKGMYNIFSYMGEGTTVIIVINRNTNTYSKLVLIKYYLNIHLIAITYFLNDLFGGFRR